MLNAELIVKFENISDLKNDFNVVAIYFNEAENQGNEEKRRDETGRKRHTTTEFHNYRVSTISR